MEYAGAIYHVMNRGDRREPIFQDDADRKRFVVTLAGQLQMGSWTYAANRVAKLKSQPKDQNEFMLG
jgi:hypothetical protein